MLPRIVMMKESITGYEEELGEMDFREISPKIVRGSDTGIKSSPFDETSTHIFPSDSGTQIQDNMLDVRIFAAATCEELNRHKC